jgi:hypothetical protein
MFSQENAHSLRYGSEMLGLILEISKIAMSSWQPISSEILGFRCPSGAASAFPMPKWPSAILLRAPVILEMGKPSHGKRENRWPRWRPVITAAVARAPRDGARPVLGHVPWGPAMIGYESYGEIPSVLPTSSSCSALADVMKNHAFQGSPQYIN